MKKKIALLLATLLCIVASATAVLAEDPPIGDRVIKPTPTPIVVINEDPPIGD